MVSKLLARVRKRVNWIARYNAEYVTAGYVPAGKGPPDLAGECVEVETTEQLDQVAPEIPTIYPLKRLHQAIDQGRILLLLRAPAENGKPGPLVGFRVCERGRFHSLGLKMPLPQTMLFTHYAEVFEQYRGRGYATELGKCARRYGLPRGMVVHCGTVASKNTTAYNAHIRSGHTRAVATVHRLDLWGGRFVWRTSAAKILGALEAVASKGGVAEEIPPRSGGA